MLTFLFMSANQKFQVLHFFYILESRCFSCTGGLQELLVKRMIARESYLSLIGSIFHIEECTMLLNYRNLNHQYEK